MKCKHEWVYGMDKNYCSKCGVVEVIEGVRYKNTVCEKQAWLDANDEELYRYSTKY